MVSTNVDPRRTTLEPRRTRCYITPRRTPNMNHSDGGEDRVSASGTKSARVQRTKETQTKSASIFQCNAILRNATLPRPQHHSHQQQHHLFLSARHPHPLLPPSRHPLSPPPPESSAVAAPQLTATGTNTARPWAARPYARSWTASRGAAAPSPARAALGACRAARRSGSS